MKKLKKIFFEGISWLAMLVLTLTSVPQIILNFQRQSTEGVSWLMFGMLLFGMSIMFTRSLATKADIVIRLNYGVGAFLTLLVNIQIFYFRFLA